MRSRNPLTDTVCVLALQVAATLAVAGGLGAADLELRMAPSSAPAGGWVQLQFFLSQPQQVASGRLTVTLDPAVFGPVQDAAVFSANGDGYGLIETAGSRVNVQFFSGTATLGQLNNVPLVVMTVAVLPSATEGQIISVAVDPGQGLWNDANGATYTVKANPGLVTVGGQLSVRSVSPGGGQLELGTVLRIQGTGFGADTTAAIEGVSLSSVRVMSPQEIEATLGAGTELTGKRVLVRNAGNPAVAFFSSLETKVAGNAWNNALPLFPAAGWAARACVSFPSSGGHRLALQNPTVSPIEVSLTNRFSRTRNVVTVPPGSVTYTDAGTGQVAVEATGTVRILKFDLLATAIGSYTVVETVTELNCAARPPEPPPAPIIASPAVLSWEWQLGTPPPPSRTVSLQGRGSYFLSSTGGSWLIATANLICATPEVCSWSSASVSVVPTGLAPGMYQGSILIRSQDPAVEPARIPVALTVTQSPVALLSTSPASLNFQAPLGGTVSPQTVVITANGVPGTFRVDTTGPFTATPVTGTLPATIGVVVTARAVGKFSGKVTVTGPQNTVEIPVTAQLFGVSVNPTSLTYSLRRGAPSQSKTVLVEVSSSTTPTIAASTEFGSWLSAHPGRSTSELAVDVNPAGLESGTYRGVVTMSVAEAPATKIPVTLEVWSDPPPLTATPSSLAFLCPMGSPEEMPAQNVTIESGGVVLPLTWKLTPGLVYPLGFPEFTAATFAVYAERSCGTGLKDVPAAVEVSAPSGTLRVPVTITPVPSAQVPPRIGAVVNAASQAPGAVAAGEMVSVYGLLAGSKILFDGQPAEVTYASPYQTVVVVPPKAAGLDTTVLEAAYGNVKSTRWGIPVAAAAPALFTDAMNGVGQAAMTNEDGSRNGGSNPAARGTLVTFYVTGLGPGDVGVTIGGIDAAVEFQGEAIGGITAMGVRVPQTVIPGPAVPVVVQSVGVLSPAGVTIAVN